MQAREGNGTPQPDVVSMQIIDGRVRGEYLNEAPSERGGSRWAARDVWSHPVK